MGVGDDKKYCGERPYEWKLKDLQDLKIDEKITMEKGCGRDEHQLRSKGWDWPDNGEFQYAGEGSKCKICKNDKGCACPKSNMPGNRGRIKRIAYKGNKDLCCKNQNKTQGIYTCNPKYVNGFQSGDCDTSMVNYCKEGINFTKDICQDWCRTVRGAGGTRKYKCDEVVHNYCTNNPNESKCKCLQGPDNLDAVQKLTPYHYACWYEPCKTIQTDTYLTQEFRDKQCPTTNCIINDVDIEGVDAVIIENKCGSEWLKEGAGGTAPSTPVDGPGGPGPGMPGLPGLEGNQTLIFGGISVSSAFMLIMSLIAVYMYMSQSKKTGPPSTTDFSF